MTKILVTDPLAEPGVALLHEDAEADLSYTLSHEELIDTIPTYDALIVRSGTQVTRDVIEAGTALRVIGRAGTGVDNIDLAAATEHGIMVVNAPTANCVAAAEHTIALLMAVARNIPQADATMRRGEWNRHRFVGTAVIDKTLGLIGFGRVGSEVARRGKGLGMRVVAYDPYMPIERARSMGVELLDFDEVLQQADFLSLHAPLNEQTEGMIDAESLASMREGSYLINAARGGLVDEDALYRALTDGQLAGAALDVFVEEPPEDSPLVGLPHVVTTPHLGASTTEAQVGVAVEVAEAVLAALRGELAPTTVNAAMVPPDALDELAPYVDLAERLARLAVQLVRGAPGEVRAIYKGEPGRGDTRLLRAAIIKGLLEPITEQRINLVNADWVAEQRGLRLVEERHSSDGGRPSTITVQLANGDVQIVEGAIVRGAPHVIRIGDFWIDLELQGCILLCRNIDRPGMIGQVGTLLGREEINISFMQVGRDHPRGEAVMAIGLDEVPPDRLIEEIAALPDISGAQLVRI